MAISVVIPSRSGRDLLEEMLPPLRRELDSTTSEIIVVDNGSEDNTTDWLRATYPAIRIERSPTPLSFARAVNRGIASAHYSHTCLLNNDMIVQPGFFGPLLNAFKAVPDLFGATGQIFFPPGVRREETGKAVMRQTKPTDFPVRCDEPIDGEDLSYVLYGSGGCSLYSTDKLRTLGGVGEIFEPAYVEDLDLGYRAWLRGWPTVFVARAQVEHRHRATTSRYFTPEQLSGFVETNYLKFLAHSVGSRAVFRRLWRQAIDRLQMRSIEGDRGAYSALLKASRIALLPGRTAAPAEIEERILALTGGDVAVFPGRAPRGLTTVLVATPYLPFPLSHGGAVRMFNLISRAARGRDQILVAFCDELATPPRELLEFCTEIVLVRRAGTHFRASSNRPDVVEEFDSLAFHAALRQTVRKWNPGIAQLEFTQMAQYALDCAPARTILVEHDITFDLQEQLLRDRDDWELRRQLDRWRTFEIDAWKNVDCVITMSEKDRRLAGEKAVSLPNGVDLERFRSSGPEPETGRLLFIGSFAHLPNLLALDFFLREVWPLLSGSGATLHIIAGSRHEYFLEYYNVPLLSLQIRGAGIELEGFVSDVRPAYERAAIVIAPLIASAGTNIKILEAMAMRKAIVSTNAGINGLDLTDGKDILIADSAADFAVAIRRLIERPDRRRELEARSRVTVEEQYGWDRISQMQDMLYDKYGARSL